MGYEILVTLFLIVLMPLVLLGFIAFWTLVKRDRAFIEDTWRSYARSRHHEYLPARGEWPNRTSPSVRWRSGELRLQLFVVGVEADARTRLVAWPSGKLLGSFVVREKRSRRDGRRNGNVGIHDPAFACAFTVASKPANLAVRVLSDRARRALLGFWQRDDVVLTYRRGKLTLDWPGRESNDARLDEAVRVMEDLVRGVEDAFHHTTAPTVEVLGEQHAE